MKRLILLAVSLVFLPTIARADWQPIVADLLAAEKPVGYGGLCGVHVDPATGEILINLSDKGFYRSTDQGKTWKRTHEAVIKGRTETPGCFLRDPSGKSKTIVAALVYGAPIMVSKDDGATWKAMDKKSAHVDWCAVDWPEAGFVLTLKHESGDLLLASNDGGQTFREIGKGFGPAWVFDAKTAVVAETKTKDRQTPRLMRTTDAGKTFEPVGEHFAKALPRPSGNKLYWLTSNSLIVSEDQGKTFTTVGAVKDGRFGPVFGKTDAHQFILTGGGIIESKDGGKKWSVPIALPKELKQVGNLSWLGYDAANDILYAMKMASDLHQLKRAEK